jgi:hypothetical protein
VDYGLLACHVIRVDRLLKSFGPHSRRPKICG